MITKFIPKTRKKWDRRYGYSKQQVRLSIPSHLVVRPRLHRQGHLPKTTAERETKSKAEEDRNRNEGKKGNQDQSKKRRWTPK